jgi:hypothetical protein
MGVDLIQLAQDIQFWDFMNNVVITGVPYEAGNVSTS